MGRPLATRSSSLFELRLPAVTERLQRCVQCLDSSKLSMRLDENLLTQTSVAAAPPVPFQGCQAPVQSKAPSTPSFSLNRYAPTALLAGCYEP